MVRKNRGCELGPMWAGARLTGSTQNRRDSSAHAGLNRRDARATAGHSLDRQRGTGHQCLAAYSKNASQKAVRKFANLPQQRGWSQQPRPFNLRRAWTTSMATSAEGDFQTITGQLRRFPNKAQMANSVHVELLPALPSASPLPIPPSGRGGAIRIKITDPAVIRPLARRLLLPWRTVKVGGWGTQ